jgi:hypothetical protein
MFEAFDSIREGAKVLYFWESHRPRILYHSPNQLVINYIILL